MKTVQSVLVLLGILLLGLPGLSVAEESSAVELRNTLSRHLDREGYLGRFPNGQDLDRAVSAYLWDHRHELRSVDFPHQQKYEVLICLLLAKGYAGFSRQAAAEDFNRWCGKMTK